MQADTGATWSVNKLGEWIKPTEIVDGGTKHLHGVMEAGLRAETGSTHGNDDNDNDSDSDRHRTMSVSAMDAAVANFGELTGYPSPVNITADTQTYGASYVLLPGCSVDCGAPLMIRCVVSFLATSPRTRGLRAGTGTAAPSSLYLITSSLLHDVLSFVLPLRTVRTYVSSSACVRACVLYSNKCPYVCMCIMHEHAMYRAFGW